MKKLKIMEQYWNNAKHPPEEKKDVLAYTEDGDIYMAQYRQNGWQLYFISEGLQFCGETITHWMPLPEPPKNKL